MIGAPPRKKREERSCWAIAMTDARRARSKARRGGGTGVPSVLGSPEVSFAVTFLASFMTSVIFALIGSRPRQPDPEDGFHPNEYERGDPTPPLTGSGFRDLSSTSLPGLLKELKRLHLKSRLAAQEELMLRLPDDVTRDWVAAVIEKGELAELAGYLPGRDEAGALAAWQTAAHKALREELEALETMESEQGHEPQPPRR